MSETLINTFFYLFSKNIEISTSLITQITKLLLQQKKTLKINWINLNDHSVIIMRSKLPSLILLSLLALTQGSGANGDYGTCSAHVTETCGEPGSDWEQGACNAIHGGFKGNSNNLHQLMTEHFKDSFKFMLMVWRIKKKFFTCRLHLSELI